MAAERRKREEERKRASEEANKAVKTKVKEKVLVAGKPRSKGKSKAREVPPMDLESNLRRFGDGPTESEDTMMLAMEVSRHQKEVNWIQKRIGESSKQKERERSEDSEGAESSKRVRMSETTSVQCDQ